MYLVCPHLDPLSLHDALPIWVAGGGCVWLQPVQPRPHRASMVQPYLLSMYTEPGFRRRGVASMVVKEAMGWCRKNKYERLMLHASEDRKSTRLNSSHRCISYALISTLFPSTTLFRSGLRVEVVSGFNLSSRGLIARRWSSRTSCRCILSPVFVDGASRRWS